MACKLYGGTDIGRKQGFKSGFVPLLMLGPRMQEIPENLFERLDQATLPEEPFANHRAAPAMANNLAKMKMKMK